MLVLLLALLSAVPLPARPAHYVTDNAAVLDAARAAALDHKLAEFERETSNQLLVYIDRDLPPETTLEEFSSQALHEWKVGQQGKDNGAILFLFTDARKMRIETGYGVEEKLTDAKAKRITSTVIKPLLQKNDPTGAVEAGTAAMMDTLRGLDFHGTGKTVAQTQQVESTSWAIVALAMAVPFLFLCFVVGLIVAIGRLRRGGAFVKTQTASGTSWTWSSSSSDSSDSSDSSSSSSSDSFSGGGGDGGGGGSSDSW
ncbi:MAG TPA: TPM domain-containing protein [Thermoanaerobaculia bacterium]|nr:TPM domain-containing protein [Thermoanaerobaculia bacterium]